MRLTKFLVGFALLYAVLAKSVQIFSITIKRDVNGKLLVASFAFFECISDVFVLVNIDRKVVRIYCCLRDHGGGLLFIENFLERINTLLFKRRTLKVTAQ